MSEETQDQQQNDDGIEARIASLTARRAEAESKAQTAAQENQELLSRISNLEATLASSKRPDAPSAREPLSFDNARDEGKKTSSGLTPEAIAEIVKNEVSSAIAPINERFQTSDLLSQQERAFSQAAREMPDLKDEGSELSKITNQLWAAREDIRKLPDAPLVVARLARGVLADVTRADKVVKDQKRNAAVTPARPNTSRELLRDRGEDNSELAEETLQKVLNSTETVGVRGLQDMLRARMTQELNKRDN